MKKRINDIRIRKVLSKEENSSRPVLCNLNDTNSLKSMESRFDCENESVFEDSGIKKQEKLQPIMEETNLLFSQDESAMNFKELVSHNRRNFLKIMVASGGVLLAGSFLNKINKFQNISLVNQSAKTNIGSMPMPVMPEIVAEQGLASDYQSFFENFRLVKNNKEYILYNKHGDNILTIDRDI